MNATSIVLDKFAHYINYKGEVPALRLDAPLHPVVEATSEQEAFLAIYSPLDDTAMLKNAPCDFERLRNNYKLRREQMAFKINISNK
jgi:erythronate-4-phosphate dehydrogenase